MSITIPVLVGGGQSLPYSPGIGLNDNTTALSDYVALVAVYIQLF